MENKKPNVIPNQEQISAANAANDARLAKEGAVEQQAISPAEAEALRQMEEQAKKQVESIKAGEQPIRPDLVDETQVKRVAVGTKGMEQQRPVIQQAKAEPKQITPKVEIPTNNEPTALIEEPYDLIPLPSEGKIYPHKRSALKIAYLNATDENILTSPNILESGDFLRILLNRKILDADVRIEDLHVGDRNAIMIWLRATGYGEMYPIVVHDDDGDPFEAEVDLSTLPYKKLGAEPDAEGLFDFHLERSKKNIKFKFLTVGEIDEINELIEYEINELNLPYSSGVTHRLERVIVEIDGIRDKEAIKKFISILPAADSRALRKYYEEIESNVDLRIQVETPKYEGNDGEVLGGDLVDTFLPINFNFFWPDLGL